MQTKKPEQLPSIKSMRGIFKRATGTANAHITMQPENVGSGAWVAELEAAWRNCYDLTTHAIQNNSPCVSDILKAQRLLFKSLNTERSRSATEKLRDR